MYSPRDSVDPSFLGQGCEIDGDGSAGSDRCGDADIHQRLPILGGVPARSICGAVDSNLDNRRRLETGRQRFEKTVHIAPEVASAKFENSDCLTCGRLAGRKIVQARDIGGRQQRSSKNSISILAADRLVIQSKDSLHDSS